ncbi:hypothetical protein, partial [Sutterella wadsworthensis]|uniref:hypothetical protein n=1 Tax=Sutterella wadsworthensis TaxID=40545 RepID=UPI0032BF6691
SFLNSSKMEITGSTVFYYGTYMYGSNENIQVTKFNKSGDTYDGNYTIDLSKYASMSGMDANNWNGLMVQSPQLKIQFSDEDLALVDEDWLAQTNNGENVNLENAEGSSQINLDHENKTSTISAKIPLKDGTTKTVNFNVDTKNELFDMDTFKNEYKAKVTTTATIMSMDGEKLQSYDLTLELQKDGTQKVTLDTGGKINSDNVYNYMINFDNSKMILNNSDDYYKLGGFQMQGENTGNKTVFDADIPTGIQINDDGEGNFSSVTSMGSFLNMFANLEITIK